MAGEEAAGHNINNQQSHSENFICGVVEGFYGRPWTTEQRKDLFRKLNKWGMDSYVYAPKDDYKHRVYWRELYTVEEADHLTGLISAAKENNIVFYYALSPGLDMTYSSAKEVTTLKRKLEQVSQFGCEAFALLFDDIVFEMSKCDKEAFQTFAHAQVSVTNEIYNHLNCPRFLFCPTQYCSTRATPSVLNSEYLNTLGHKLAPKIDILWTGEKVISKLLTVENIQEITEVLRRPPVIWDNLHANDYDQKRVFLGPYSGRSPELIPLLRGVVTNPNCEFHPNTIAIQTLAYWSKCTSENKISNSISADIKLETENEEGISSEDGPVELSRNIYHPRAALRKAIADWLPEFFVEKEAFGPITKPQPHLTMVVPIPIIPSINTCMSLTTTTTTSSGSSQLKMPEVNTTQLQALAEVCSSVSTTMANSGAPMVSTQAHQNPVEVISNTIMNSLVSPTKVVTSDTLPNTNSVQNITSISIPNKIPVSSITVPIMSIRDCNVKPLVEFDGDKKSIEEDEELLETKSDEPMPHVKEIANKLNEDFAVPLAATEEPMDCNNSVNVSPKHLSKSPQNTMIASTGEDVMMAESVSTCSAGSMQVESSDTSLVSAHEMADEEKADAVTLEDLSLLCDLFYLPFEHGSRALQLLNEFYWLKSNASVLVHAPKRGTADMVNAKPEVLEWFQRCDKFSLLCQAVLTLTKKIAVCSNKELVYDLFSYVWDISTVISLLNAFTRWLALGYFPANIDSFTQGSYTWFSKGWRETFMSGDQEPWVFRGGLTADLQRLIPVDSGNDLFLYKMPETPTTNLMTFRPYTHQDEDDLYAIYMQGFYEKQAIMSTCRDPLDRVKADHHLAPFLTICPELTLVSQNAANKTIGFACGALDMRTFQRNQQMCWIPAMVEKYPSEWLDTKTELHQSVRDSMAYFHRRIKDSDVSACVLSDDLLNTYPSVLICSVLKEVEEDQSIAKRLITLLLAALRSNGSFGAHVCLAVGDIADQQFYLKLGFNEVQRDTICVYLGRNF